jgi:starvation-inducible DNA-binding protein
MATATRTERRSSRTATAERQESGRRSGRDGSQAAPHLARLGREVQPFGKVHDIPIDLDERARAESCEILNRVLADSTILYALYKKHHWNVAGPTFYQLHLLFDKHAEEQLELVDLLGERVQTLGGIAVGDPRHAAELTSIERAPDGAEDVPAQITRLLEAHRTIIGKVRDGIERTEKNKDYGSNDLLMGDVLRRHELQVWFLSAHLVEVPLLED